MIPYHIEPIFVSRRLSTFTATLLYEFISWFYIKIAWGPTGGLWTSQSQHKQHRGGSSVQKEFNKSYKLYLHTERV